MSHSEDSYRAKKEEKKQLSRFWSSENFTLHLFVLNAFFIAQPLFELLSKNTPFFTARNTQWWEILLLTLLISAFIPTLIRVLFKELKTDNLNFRILFTTLFFLGFAPIIKTLMPALTTITFFPILTILSILASRFYFSNQTLRRLLTFLSPVIIIFPLIFLVFSPVKKLVFQTTTLPKAPTIESNIPVTLVVLDELPLTGLLDQEGQIDSHLYPNFARLANQSTWYKNATTVHDRTAFAVPAIFSGLMPDTFRAGTFKGYPKNIFTLFRNSYEFNIYENTSRLCPPQLCQPITDPFLKRLNSHLNDIGLIYGHLILPNDLTTKLPSIDKDWANFWDTTQGVQNRATAFKRWISSINGNKKSLNVIHIELPHGPRVFLPSGKIYDDGSQTRPLYGFKKNDSTGFNEWITPWLRTQHYQRQLMQLQYTDNLLGLLLDRLESQEVLDIGLLIVTADHGISFQMNTPVRDLVDSNFMDIMPVPLFVKYPDQTKKEVSSAQAETIDILPTIVKELGIQTDWKLPGEALQKELKRNTKVAYNRDLEKFEFTLDKFDAQNETLKKKHNLLLPNTLTPNTSIYGLPLSSFGQPLDSFSMTNTTTETTKITFKLDNPNALKNLNLDSDSIPALILGELTLSDSSTLPTNKTHSLLLFLNNKLVSYTQPEPFNNNKTGFGFLVPEDAFKNGNNDVKLFLIKDPFFSLELIPLEETP